MEGSNNNNSKDLNLFKKSILPCTILNKKRKSDAIEDINVNEDISGLSELFQNLSIQRKIRIIEPNNQASTFYLDESEEEEETKKKLEEQDKELNQTNKIISSSEKNNSLRIGSKIINKNHQQAVDPSQDDKQTNIISSNTSKQSETTFSSQIQEADKSNKFVSNNNINLSSFEVFSSKQELPQQNGLLKFIELFNNQNQELINLFSESSQFEIIGSLQQTTNVADNILLLRKYFESFKIDHISSQQDEQKDKYISNLLGTALNDGGKYSRKFSASAKINCDNQLICHIRMQFM